MCQLNNRLREVAYLTKIVNDSETVYAQTVQRRWTLLNELEHLALDGVFGIYVNLCTIQRYIAERGMTCSLPRYSPGGGSANSRLSRDERFALNCNSLRKIETLLDSCVALIRQVAARQTRGMTSS